MNAILKQSLSLLMRAIVGGVNWERVKAVVLMLMDSSIPGEDKQKAAVAELKSVVTGLSTRLLNFAIEAAVVWAKK